MEHSYDGDSSVSSDGQIFKSAAAGQSADTQRYQEHVRKDEFISSAHGKDLIRISRLAPGVRLQPRRGESVPPCYMNLLSDRQLLNILSYLDSQVITLNNIKLLKQT